MKKYKSFISIAICSVILLTMIFTSIVVSADDVPEFDATKPYLKASSSPVKAGETVSITFEIKNNSLSIDGHDGFWGMRHTLNFDKDVLSFVAGKTESGRVLPKYEVGENFSDLVVSPINEIGELSFVYTNDSGNFTNNKSDGVLFTIDFKVADNAPAGTYYFDYVDYTDASVIDVDGNSVEFTYNRPSVVVYDDSESEETTTTVVVDTKISLSMVDGASIRLNDKNGLRFYTLVDKEKVTSLRSMGYTVEFGTLIAPADYLEDDELDFELGAGKFADVKYLSDNYYTENNGFEGVVGSIVNIRETTQANSETGNITRKFVGRGYAKVTDEDGNTTISYADYSLQNARSLGYVAHCLKNDTSTVAKELYELNKQNVDKWALMYENYKDPALEDKF